MEIPQGCPCIYEYWMYCLGEIKNWVCLLLLEAVVVCLLTFPIPPPPNPQYELPKPQIDQVNWCIRVTRLAQVLVMQAFNSRGKHICEFEATLVYRVHSKITRAQKDTAWGIVCCDGP